VAVREHDRVRLVSRYGSVVLPVRVDSGVRPGQLFATFHNPAVFVNAVTGPHRDTLVGTPEYKTTAVRIEPVGASEIQPSGGGSRPDGGHHAAPR
jgi:formate dehydrogenase major subunit